MILRIVVGEVGLHWRSSLTGIGEGDHKWGDEVGLARWQMLTLLLVFYLSSACAWTRRSMMVSTDPWRHGGSRPPESIRSGRVLSVLM